MPKSGLQIIPITALAARDLQLNCVCKIFFAHFILLLPRSVHPKYWNESALIITGLGLFFCLLGQDSEAADMESWEESF